MPRTPSKLRARTCRAAGSASPPSRGRGGASSRLEDNGCGIEPENLDKIFDPFFTTKEVGKGTGQGLAISRSIVVDRHGGALDVHSIVGTGTRFTIRMPVMPL